LCRSTALCSHVRVARLS